MKVAYPGSQRHSGGRLPVRWPGARWRGPPPPARRSRRGRLRVEAGKAADVGCGCGFEQLLGPGDGFEQLHREAHQRRMRGDVGRHLEIALVGAPAESGAKIAQLGLHPVDGVTPPGPVPMLPPGGSRPGKMRRVPVARPVLPGRLGKAVLGELADGLVHADTACVGPRDRRRRAIADQRVELSENLHVVGIPDNGADAGEVEAAGEHGGGAEQALLVRAQQRVRPVHRVAQRVLALRSRGRDLQQPESIGEPVTDLDRAHRRHPGRGQLDPQRKPIEGLADLEHRRGGLRIVKSEVRSDSSRPVDEQRDGVRGDPTVQRQRLHRQRRLAVHLEVLT